MFGSHFYDEICADQEHMRLVAHMCHTARTEKDVLNLSVTTLVNNDVFDKNLVQSASCDRIILTVTEEPRTEPKVEALRLFEDSEEYLVAEMGTIPYASQPTSVRVVRSPSNIPLGHYYWVTTWLRKGYKMFSAKTAQLANQPHLPAINLSTRALKRLLMSGLLITGFSMVEFVYVLPVTSPTINPYIGYAVTILTYSASILLWLRLAFIDPGRLPHVHHSCDAESSTEVVTHAQTGIVFYAGGTIFDTSTCAICGMTLPPETDHCEETNECIVALDHYCPWVGLPIGMRNMLPFVVSLSSLCIHSIWCFFLGVVALVHASTVNDIILGITCLMGSFFGGAFTGGMWGWTLYDVLRDNSPRLYSLCNLQSQTEIRKDDSAHTRNCPKEVIESVHSFVESKMKWLKHPGLRRFVLGSYLPVLYYLSPEQAEYQAWAWTIVLCGTTPL